MADRQEGIQTDRQEGIQTVRQEGIQTVKLGNSGASFRCVVSYGQIPGLDRAGRWVYSGRPTG